MQEDQVRMQEALYAQENQLNLERADKNNLQVAVMNEKEEKNQLKEKLKQFQTKAKKYEKVLKDSQSMHKNLQDKKLEISKLNAQLAEIQQKSSQVDKITATNKDLVTKNCALKSSIQLKDKEIVNLNDRIKELEADLESVTSELGDARVDKHEETRRKNPCGDHLELGKLNLPYTQRGTEAIRHAKTGDQS